MKKFLTVLLALLLLCGSCLAEGLNYASMTDAQLHERADQTGACGRRKDGAV